MPTMSFQLRIQEVFDLECEMEKTTYKNFTKSPKATNKRPSDHIVLQDGQAGAFKKGWDQ